MMRIRFTCPTLIISDADVQLRSKVEAIELLEQLPHTKLEIINSTGHMIPIEQSKHWL